MAVEEFKVIYNRQVAGTQLPPNVETSKTAAEALHGSFKEKVILKGPIEEAKVVTVEAETEKQAALAARVLLGANEAEGELLVAKATNVKKNSGRG